MYDFDYSVNIFFVNIYHIYSELAQLADGVILENLFSLVEPVHGSFEEQSESLHRRCDALI